MGGERNVYEAVPCRSLCSVYEWVTEPWSFCSVNSVDLLPACGEGVQSRKIRCVLRGSDYSSSVNDSLCDADEMPVQAQTCMLPCPGDCVMSPWSHWSLCPTVRTCTHRTRKHPHHTHHKPSHPRLAQLHSSQLYHIHNHQNHSHHNHITTIRLNPRLAHQ
ncbi:hypothetical protein NFI96_000524 [Prochilodus magdalenae]|nr:hypothetical protein NFI96_000524 [Prochilodus magdalenae]